MVITGNGGLGSDSGEGALKMATTSKEGSRRVNYPMQILWGSDKIYYQSILNIVLNKMC